MDLKEGHARFGSPRISIVVPSFNASATIGRTLSSLRLQNYENLQVICVDACSQDDTLAVIQTFGDVVDHIIVERDRNIADGLNKGFRLADGDLLGWLCADDELTEGALNAFAEAFANQPQAGLITGGCHRVFPNGVEFDTTPPPQFQQKLRLMNPIEQPSTLWRAAVHRAAGELDVSYDLAFDWEWWCRLSARGVAFHSIDRIQSIYHFSENNKTSQGGRKLVREMFRGTKTYGPPMVGHLYYFLYLAFDLRGFYDWPPPRAPESMAAFRFLRRVLSRIFSPEIVDAYNWNFASKQERGMVWYAQTEPKIVRPWWEKLTVLVGRWIEHTIHRRQHGLSSPSSNAGVPGAADSAAADPQLSVSSEELQAQTETKTGGFGLTSALQGLKSRGFEPRVVLDGGAADGRWTTQVRQIWPAARFVMVEALEERRLVLETLAASAPEHIQAFIGGLADVNGTLQFSVTDYMFDSSFAYGGGSARPVSTYRLDDLVSQGVMPQPDFIKLDVQGFELHVLRGGETVLSRTDCVLLECNFLKFSDAMPDLEEVVQWMGVHNFRPYEFVDFLRRPLDNAMGQCDILFVRKDHVLVADRRWAAG
jgi:FkbM family methyltransferase